jgi:hypothetical protein
MMTNKEKLDTFLVGVGYFIVGMIASILCYGGGMK